MGPVSPLHRRIVGDFEEKKSPEIVSPSRDLNLSHLQLEGRKNDIREYGARNNISLHCPDIGEIATDMLQLSPDAACLCRAP